MSLDSKSRIAPSANEPIFSDGTLVSFSSGGQITLTNALIISSINFALDVLLPRTVQHLRKKLAVPVGLDANREALMKERRIEFFGSPPNWSINLAVAVQSVHRVFLLCWLR